MKGEIEYASKVFEESPSNYDLSKITDENEVKFIKWINILQGTTTVFAYEIKVYNYYCGLYLLNDTIQTHYNVFFCTLLENLSADISIKFAKLIKTENEMCIQQLRDFCHEIDYVFTVIDYKTCFREIRELINDTHSKYELHYKTARNKIFAHTDLILLDEKEIIKIMDQSLTETTNKMLNNIKKILNKIWFSYSGHNLCYRFKGDNDYKDIVKTLWEKYGNTKFID